MAIAYNSNYNETMPFSDVCAQMALAPDTVLTYNVPGPDSARYQAYFDYPSNSSIYVGKNSTPAIPVAGTLTEDPYVEHKPVKRYVNGGDVLSFISAAAVTLGFSLRQVQKN